MNDLATPVIQIANLSKIDGLSFEILGSRLDEILVGKADLCYVSSTGSGRQRHRASTVYELAEWRR